MKKIFTIICAICIASGILLAADFIGKVVRVSDGDTIVVLVNKEQIRVRLYGIDCPEKGQAFGNVAKLRVAELCAGKQVRIIKRGNDRYKRVIGEVILPNGQNLNHLLVREGLAWHYKSFSKSKVLSQLEKEAKAAKRGLWKDKAPIPPWEFRLRR